MMSHSLSPAQLTVIGGVLLIFGFLGPLAMVVEWIQTTLFLCFASAISSTFGMIVGMYGLFLFVRRHRDN